MKPKPPSKKAGKIPNSGETNKRSTSRKLQNNTTIRKLKRQRQWKQLRNTALASITATKPYALAPTNQLTAVTTRNSLIPTSALPAATLVLTKA